MRDFSGFPKHEVLTLQDLVFKLTLRFGGAPGTYNDARVAEAIRSAMRSLCGKHRWNYYRRSTRINTTAQVDMVISYDHSGGLYERLATITSGGYWPQDADQGDILMDDRFYRIEKRISDVQAVLESDFTLRGDTTGTATWRRNAYQFPREIQCVHNAHNITTRRPLTQLPPSDFDMAGYRPLISGYVRHFTWKNHGGKFGATEFILYPHPLVAETIEVNASVLPHIPYLANLSGNTLTGTQGESTVVCSGAQFNSSVLGAVIRVGRSSTEPTGLDSSNWVHQAFITSVTNSTTVTISEPLPESYSGRGYTVSSPIDIEASVMLEALEDEAFFQYTKNHDHAKMQIAAELSKKSLLDAMSRDNKTTGDAYTNSLNWFYPFTLTGVVQVGGETAVSEQTTFVSDLPSNDIGTDGDQAFIGSGNLEGAIYEKRAGVWTFVGQHRLALRTTNPSTPLPTGFQFVLYDQTPSSNNALWMWNGSVFEKKVQYA